MKKVHSLKGKNSFDLVFKKGTRLKGKGLFCAVYINSMDSGSGIDIQNDKKIKFGIVITKKFGKAFKRIKEKRRIREILRVYLKDIIKPCMVVFRIYNEFDNLSFIEKKKEVECLLKRAGLVK